MEKNDSSAFFAYILGGFVGFVKGFICGIFFIKFIYPKLIDMYDDYMNNEEFLFDDEMIEKEVYIEKENKNEKVDKEEDLFEKELEETE